MCGECAGPVDWVGCVQWRRSCVVPLETFLGQQSHHHHHHRHHCHRHRHHHCHRHCHHHHHHCRQHGCFDLVITLVRNFSINLNE